MILFCVVFSESFGINIQTIMLLRKIYYILLKTLFCGSIFFNLILLRIFVLSLRPLLICCYKLWHGAQISCYGYCSVHVLVDHHKPNQYFNLLVTTILTIIITLCTSSSPFNIRVKAFNSSL